MSGTSFTSCADAQRVLADPRYAVPEAPPGERGLAWLRATVSRFTNGETHARRRRLVEEELARLDPVALRAEARARTAAALADAGGQVEVMRALARPVPLAALCSALGVHEHALAEVVADAIVLGPAYVPGAGGDEVDAAVERLRDMLRREDDERTAAAIAVPAQACEATAGLIGNAVARAAESTTHVSVEALLEETLRLAPPLRPARRVGPEGEVTIDLAAATLDAPDGSAVLAFGTGVRPCPGRAEAFVLASGVLEELLPRCASVEAVAWDDPSGVPMPSRLEVALR